MHESLTACTAWQFLGSTSCVLLHNLQFYRPLSSSLSAIHILFCIINHANSSHFGAMCTSATIRWVPIFPSNHKIHRSCSTTEHPSSHRSGRVSDRAHPALAPYHPDRLVACRSCAVVFIRTARVSRHTEAGPASPLRATPALAQSPSIRLGLVPSFSFFPFLPARWRSTWPWKEGAARPCGAAVSAPPNTRPSGARPPPP
jgi:hypothetical protein